MQRYEKLSENLFGAHLVYGKIDLKPTHEFSCLFIVQHTEERDFIKDQILQLLLAGCRNFDFFGEKTSLWLDAFQEVHATLFPDRTVESMYHNTAWKTLEGFTENLKKHLHVRYFVPHDFYLLYDDENIYNRVLELLKRRPAAFI